MDTFKLTSRSTISDIAFEIENQFGIDEKEAREAARAVKYARKHGTLLWSATRLVTTDRNALNYQVR
jgi:hypothetical protein